MACLSHSLQNPLLQDTKILGRPARIGTGNKGNFCWACPRSSVRSQPSNLHFYDTKHPENSTPHPKPLQNILLQAAAGIFELPSEAGRAAALTVDYPFPLNFSLHFLYPPSWEEQLRLWSLCCSWSTAGNCRKSVTLEICLLPECDSPVREKCKGSSPLYP